MVTKGQLIDIARQKTITSISLEIGFPIFTITNEQDPQSSTKPSITYLKTIIEKFRESHWLDNLTIFDYLKTKQCVIENYSKEELISIISENED
ncbi:hypothetical protein [Sphingobacterium zeae]|uniref:hypothetical protein n=1 Tax=Sphingobacterium zeae TaxID=1776859 RepID=UPI0036229E5C